VIARILSAEFEDLLTTYSVILLKKGKPGGGNTGSACLEVQIIFS
jgi:hypothetical protein